MTDIARKLAEPFEPEIVSWRVGSVSAEKKRGMALAFVDARDVMNRLDEACGPFGWMTEHSALGARTMCRLSIRDPETGEWISRTDGCGDTDYEAEKGSFSDSLKRVAVTFGVGRYLYDVDAPWVEVEQRGKTWVIAAGELPRLRQRLPRPGKPADARSAAPPPSHAGNGTPPPAATAARPFAGPATTGRDATSTAASHTPSRTGESLPLPNPEEPPEIAEQRRAAREHFWTREHYGIDPAVIQGGMARWDAEFLAQAEAAQSLDQFLKLKQDNAEAGHTNAWAEQVRAEVKAHFVRRRSAIEARLSGGIGAAA